MSDPSTSGDVNLLTGLTVEEAKKKFPGIVIRIVCEDGNSKMVNSDCRLDRHNVETYNGKIVKVNHNG